MRVIWTTPARRDFRSHLDYLAARNEETALGWIDAVNAAVDRLSEFPHRGRPGRRDGTRELIINGWPYLVVYSVNDVRVLILRLLHTSQNWPPR